jgi:hypothetical protein
MIIDCHSHCTIDRTDFPSADELVEGMNRYGITKACCSMPCFGMVVTKEEVRHTNDLILGSMKKHPDRILGMCYVNPGYARESQDEITRCVCDGGMIGVKLYHQYQINEPVQFPLIERCIELGIPILMHAGYPAAPELREQQPRISIGDHFADVAQRYPEAMLICGHIGGGGDWERQLKPLREAPSVFLDTSGSVAEAGIIERCVRDLGAERLLFGCDLSMERGLGKLLDAEITERQRRMIFAENFLGILARRRK